MINIIIKKDKEHNSLTSIIKDEKVIPLTEKELEQLAQKFIDIRPDIILNCKVENQTLEEYVHPLRVDRLYKENYED